MSFIKGMTPWNKGKILARICLNCKKSFNISESFIKRGDKGIYCNKKCASLSNYEKNIHFKIAQRRNRNEESNPAWKGNKVGYRALHLWVERNLGKANHCEINQKHISTRYHWANISHKYKRNLSDWIQMCPSCNYKDIERKGQN